MEDLRKGNRARASFTLQGEHGDRIRQQHSNLTSLVKVSPHPNHAGRGKCHSESTFECSNLSVCPDSNALFK